MPLVESITMFAQTAPFILLLLLSLIEENSLEADYQCAGIRREDRSYDFKLPPDVDENVQTDGCDAEWTVDQFFTAILDGNSAHFSHPFKNVTRHGISVIYCPVSVRFHVTCPKYTRDLTCSCTNATDNPVFSTPPSREILSSGSSKRQHYCAIAVAVSFVIILGILAFFICRTNSTATYAPTSEPVDEQNHA